MPPDAANAAGVPSCCNIDVYLTFDVMRITHSMLECESSAEMTDGRPLMRSRGAF
jgi:hypothetical protein